MRRIAKSEIESKISKHRVFKAKDLELVVGKRSLIEHLVKSKMVEPLGSGFYASPQLSKFESVVLISQKYFPKAVLSGATALKLHGFLDREILLVEADIPKDTSQRSHLLTFTRVAVSRLSGIQTMDFLGVPIRVYEPERALIDCLLKKLDSRIFTEALKKYALRGQINSDHINELDQEFGTDLRKRLDAVLLKTVYTAPSANSLKPQAEQLAEADRLLEAAILVYARYGGAGLDFKKVAEESGVSLSVVTRYFRNKTNLKREILNALKARIIETGAKPLESSAYTREWLEKNVEAFLGMSEMDEIGYRIQRWCIAEQNDLIGSIIELSSQLIRGISHLIMNEVEGIDVQTAESRALLFVALLDQFANLRWYYADILNLESSKKELIENYKKNLLRQGEGLLFSPVIS